MDGGQTNPTSLNRAKKIGSWVWFDLIKLGPREEFELCLTVVKLTQHL